MNFLDLAKKRHSCRKYLDKAVEKEKIENILEAAHVAPTAANKQPHKIIVVQEKDNLEKLGASANFYKAPLAFIICGDTQDAWIRPFDEKNFADVDITIVTDHMMLEATEQGLNSLWVCFFDPEKVKKDFNIPAHYSVLSVLAVGYSAVDALSPDRHAKARKDLDSFVFYETM